MPEEKQQREVTEKSDNTQVSMGVPIAIVIAGALIAAAVYFGGGRGGAVKEAAVEGTQPPEGQKKEAQVARVKVGDIRPVGNDDHIRGADNAKVTIIEYSDYQCPFCGRFHPTLSALLKEYPDDIKWVYRHFPLEQLHDRARPTAIASECAAEQGKFWEFTDYVFSNVKSGADLTNEKLTGYARAVGVANIANFNACVASDKYNDRIDRDLEDAATAGGRGTPYSVIIGPSGQKEALSGAQPLPAVKSAVEKYL